MNFKIVSGLILSIILLNLPAHADIFDPLVGPNLSDKAFSQHPQNENFRLSTGQIIQLPLHSTPTGFMLDGTADLKALTADLAPNGAYPVEIKPGKAMVIVYAEDFKNASLGRYQELTIMVPVTQQPRNGFISEVAADLSFLMMFAPKINGVMSGKLTSTYLYIWKMFVTTKLAYDVGREVWGYPKEIAEIQLTDSDSEGTSALLDTKNSLCQINMHVSPEFFPKQPTKLAMDLFTLTPMKLGQTKRHLLLNGHAQFKKFNKVTDSFTASLGTDCGDSLARVGFRPLAWQKNTNDVQIGFH